MTRKPRVIGDGPDQPADTPPALRDRPPGNQESAVAPADDPQRRIEPSTTRQAVIGVRLQHDPRLAINAAVWILINIYQHEMTCSF